MKDGGVNAHLAKRALDKVPYDELARVAEWMLQWYARVGYDRLARMLMQEASRRAPKEEPIRED